VAEEDDDDVEGEGGEVEPAGGGLFKRKKLIIFAGLGVLLVIVAVAGIYFSGLADSLFGKKERQADAVEQNAAQGPVFYDLPEMLINLNSTDNQQHYLKIRISLELVSGLDKARTESSLPFILNDLQTYLRELRPVDLNGSSALARLKDDVAMRVNDRLRPVKVSDVLVRSILVQ
jgi:flagellar FliL protein